MVRTSVSAPLAICALPALLVAVPAVAELERDTVRMPPSWETHK